MCINELMSRAWKSPGTRYWYISPTYDQAKQQYRRLITMLTPCIDILRKNNQTELRLKLINDSEISFKSGEVLNNLRGETLHGVVIDEVREQSPDLWPLIVRPMLTTTKGWAAFVSTPKGFDQFYDFFERAKSDHDWSAIKAPSTCNPLFSAEEFESAKRDMSEGEFDQEILANFRDLQRGKAYVNFGDHNITDQNPFSDLPIAKHLPIVVGCDYNLSPMSWTLGQIAMGKSQIYWFEEIHLDNSHTQEAAEVLVSRLEGLNNEIWICGDATSKAGQRAAAGQSDYDILMKRLREANIKAVNRTPESNPLVRDRVNTVNAYLKNAAGQVSMWFNPKCKYAIRDFQRVTWKENNAVLDEGSKRELTHASDSVGYPVCELMPLRGIRDVGGPRVVTRRA